MPDRRFLASIALIIFIPIAFISFGTGPGAGLTIGVVLLVGGLAAWWLGARDDA